LIDDLRRFREPPRDAQVAIARNSKTGLEMLANDTEWDEIWLDHDLGDKTGDIDYIMPVIDYMSERAVYENPVKVNTVFVHTSNPAGAKNMMLALERYGYNAKRVIPEKYFVI
jgi:hypothetical protein